MASRVTSAGSAKWEEVISPGNYPKIQIKIKEGLSIVRAFKVPAEDVFEFGNEVSNASTFDDGQHPVFTWCYISSVDLEPFAADGAVQFQQNSDGMTEPMIWLAIVTYETMKKAIATGQNSDNSNGADLYDGNVNITSEVMLLEGSGFKWVGDAVRIAESIQMPKTIPIIDRELRIPKVVYIPWAAIRACVGCVNSVAYMGAAPQTLLYLGAGIQFKKAFDGTMNFSISHKFKEKAFLDAVGAIVTWNHFYRKLTLDWKKTNPLVYYPVNFAAAGIISGVT